MDMTGRMLLDIVQRLRDVLPNGMTGRMLLDIVQRLRDVLPNG